MRKWDDGRTGNQGAQARTSGASPMKCYQSYYQNDEESRLLSHQKGVPRAQSAQKLPDRLATKDRPTEVADHPYNNSTSQLSTLNTVVTGMNSKDHRVLPNDGGSASIQINFNPRQAENLDFSRMGQKLGLIQLKTTQPPVVDAEMRAYVDI